MIKLHVVGKGIWGNSNGNVDWSPSGMDGGILLAESGQYLLSIARSTPIYSYNQDVPRIFSLNPTSSLRRGTFWAGRINWPSKSRRRKNPGCNW